MKNIAQKGRSMVEMLGVLAIVGVLSVGAIAGYSKAMMKYKLNKQTQQIGSILDYVTLHMDDLKRVKTEARGNLKPLLTSLGAIPQEMIKKTGDQTLIWDVFNTPVAVSNYTSDGNYTFELKVSIHQNKKDSCMNLFQIAKLRSAMLWRSRLQYTQNSTVGTSGIAAGDAYCPGSSKCLKDMTLSEMEDSCNACNDKDTCIFYFQVKL